MANVNLGNPVLMDAFTKQWHGNFTGNEVEAGVKGMVQTLYNNQQALQGAVRNMATEQLELNPALMAASAEVRIAFHRTKMANGAAGDGAALSVPWWAWKTYENWGNVADGVLIIPDRGKPLMVAPTEAGCKWSPLTPDLSGQGHAYVDDYNDVFADLDGEGNCALILEHGDSIMGTAEEQWGQYAPGFCAEYGHGSMQPERDASGRVTKPVWWLPSIGEMNLIRKYRYAIDICLAQINGATPLSNQYYWTSTQYSPTNAWVMEMSAGFMYPATKAAPIGYTSANPNYFARPVTALDASIIAPAAEAAEE